MHGWGVAVALIWYCMAQRVLITALAQCWLRLAVSSAVWGGMGERFWWLHGRCRVGQLVTEYALVTSGGASITMTGEGQGLAKTYLWVTKCSVNKSGTKVTSKELGWCRGDRLAVTSKDLVEWTTTHLSPPQKKTFLVHMFGIEVSLSPAVACGTPSHRHFGRLMLVLTASSDCILWWMAPW